ncbi:MAG: ABC transporter permease [Gemmatimonadetes bacterium]|nr:ABC transporter permease [Gemmatimonadota bacterium]
MLREFLADLKAQRLRTALTILGITWGTVAVVVLLAFGTGLERQTRKRFHGLGDRIVILFGGRTTKAHQGFPEGRPIRLTEDDVALLDAEIPEIVQISPEYSSRTTPVRRGANGANPNITGVLPVYGDMRNVIPEEGGRFINQPDVDERRRVAVVGNELKKVLFGEEAAVGRQVFVGDVPFTIVGVMAPKIQNSSYNTRDQDRIFIPASTHRSIFGGRNIANMIYRTSDATITKDVERRVYELLGRRYKFDPTDEDALMVWDTSEWETMFGYLFLGFNIFFGLVGSFTLTVGGIGVANIMYIVVRERTLEIGIRRSVGATRNHILLQFFTETFFIVGIGAALGLGISLAMVRVAGLFPTNDIVGQPVLSPTVALVTVSLLAGIGFLAGLFPARKAASLDPVECLRY